VTTGGARAMDDSEKVVAAYLRSRGFAMVYEPDGNQPPDFVVDGRIAIEARRLNQHEDTSGVPRGLEESAYPLMRTVTRTLKAVGPPTGGASWFVYYRFTRPLPTGKALARALRSTLLEVMRTGIPEGTYVPAGSALRLKFQRARRPHAAMFLLGGSADRLSGGWLIGELIRNLQICVAEKTEKIGRVQSKYAEWWLAFADHIAYGGLDPQDLAQLRQGFRVERPWTRIILVSPLYPHIGFELTAPPPMPAEVQPRHSIQ
jgi:hypothetical protein